MGKEVVDYGKDRVMTAGYLAYLLSKEEFSLEDSLEDLLDIWMKTGDDAMKNAEGDFTANIYGQRIAMSKCLDKKKKTDSDLKNECKNKCTEAFGSGGDQYLP